MKTLIEKMTEGLQLLFSDETNTFYAFFTVILAECSYLFVIYDIKDIIPIVIILLGCILNVIVFSPLIGNTEGTRLEKVFSDAYKIVFVVLLVIGCFFNWKVTFATTAIAFGITALSVKIAYSMDFGFHIFTILATVFIIMIYGIFVHFFIKITWMPVLLKFVIPLVYALCCPLIAEYEDESAARDVFQLAYEVTWTPEYEKARKLFYESMKNKKD